MSQVSGINLSLMMEVLLMNNDLSRLLTENNVGYEIDPSLDTIYRLNVNEKNIDLLELIAEYKDEFKSEVMLDLENCNLNLLNSFHNFLSKVYALNMVNCVGQIDFLSKLKILRKLTLVGDKLPSMNGLKLKLTNCDFSFEEIDFDLLEGSELNIERLNIKSNCPKNYSRLGEYLKNVKFLRLPIDSLDNLSEITDLGNVQELEIFLKGKKIVYFSDVELKKVPHLTKLNKISSCMRTVSNSGVKTLVEKIPNLQVINFTGNKSITGECIDYLLELKDLKDIYFQGTNIKTRALKPLAEKFPGISIGYAR